jgi:hypothetical protein
MALTSRRYTVRQVQNLVVPDELGAIQRMVRITFTLPNRYVGTIDVPQAEASPDRVRELIDAEIIRVSALYSLGS